jgi:S-DNA-T family DNA segregation ATPase FtsK/SpoIIIE
MSIDAPLAPLSLRVVDGTRPRDVTVLGVTSSTRVRELAEALGAGAASTVEVDGRTTSLDRPLLAAGLRTGSELRITDGRAIADRAASTTARVALEWTAGPDSGRTVGLAAGSHVVGTARGLELRTDDASMTAHHATVVVDEQAGVRVRDHGVGRPVSVRRRGRGSPELGIGDQIAVGASRLTIVPAAAPHSPTAAAVRRPSAGWRVEHHRPPRAAPTAVDDALRPPRLGAGAPPAPGWSASTLLVPLLGGLAISLLLHQPIAFLLAVIGAGVGGGLAAHRQLRHRRDSHRAARDEARAMDAFRAALDRAREAATRRARIEQRGLPGAVADSHGTHRLWERRVTHADVTVVTLGIGHRRWSVPIADDLAGDRRGGPDAVWALVESMSVLDDVPITFDLTPGSHLGLTGETVGVRALARSLVVQLACQVGPADLHLVVIADGGARSWEWARWLPHAHGGGTSAVLPAELVSQRLVTTDWTRSARRIVVVVDGVRQLGVRTAPLRRLIEQHADRVAVIVLAPDGSDPPAFCDAVVTVGPDGIALVRRDDGSPGERVHFAGASLSTAASVARRLAGFADPEVDRGGAGLPTTVSLAEVDPAAAAPTLLDRWEHAGRDPSPSAVIGRADDGVVEIDLGRDGPHALVAGTTGAGKSELLRTLVAGLALSSPPELLSFVLIDYKGGSAFDSCAQLPHVVGLVTDLDEHLAARVLRSLHAELRRRERALRRSGSVDLDEHRRSGSADGLARLVLVIDEFAALASELPHFLHSLVAVAQRGRSLGVHLVLATQRPGAALSEDILANTNLRIALRMQDASDSTNVIGDGSATSLPRDAPGRAMLRLAEGELLPFQAARVTGAHQRACDQHRIRIVEGGPGAPAVVAASKADEVDGAGSAPTLLDSIVRRCRERVAERGRRSPHRPWLDPLPLRLPLRRLAITAGSPQSVGAAAEGRNAIALGLVDVPDEQLQVPLAWDPSTGHLLIVGALGSGTTTALRTAAVALARASAPRSRHLYVFDASGAGPTLGDLVELPHCGAVVPAVDVERRARLLRMLCDELDRRRSDAPGARPQIVLLVDGINRLRAALLELVDGEELDDLDRLLSDGPAVGITAVLTTDHAGAVSGALSARCSERLLLGATERSEAAMLGISLTLPRGSCPGRGVSANTGCEVQLAIDDDPRATTDELQETWCDEVRGGPPPVRTVPSRFELSDLPRPRTFSRQQVGAPLRLPVGLSRRTLDAAVLEVHEGEHVLVAGPPRSGRTTAAATIAAQWRSVMGHEGTLAVVFGGRGEGREWPGPCVTGAADEVVQRLAALQPHEPALLVVDDAELVHDERDALTSLLAQRRPNLHVVATGRADFLRAEYGHWTTWVRRSRTGLLLGAVHELDADLLGVVLPRRRDGGRTAPGRGHLVAAGSVEEVQVAIAPTSDVRLREPSSAERWSRVEPDGDQDDLELVGPGGAVGSAGQRCFG